jgi:hypothetical protein
VVPSTGGSGPLVEPPDSSPNLPASDTVKPASPSIANRANNTAGTHNDTSADDALSLSPTSEICGKERCKLLLTAIESSTTTFDSHTGREVAPALSLRQERAKLQREQLLAARGYNFTESMKSIASLHRELIRTQVIYCGRYRPILAVIPGRRDGEEAVEKDDAGLPIVEEYDQSVVDEAPATEMTAESVCSDSLIILIIR